MVPQAFSLPFPALTWVIESDVFYSIPYIPTSGKPQPQLFPFKGIWDTGASASMISSDVVKALGLFPIGRQKICHASGVDYANVYMVNIYLPNGIMVPNVSVTEGISNLIGMDIITLGDFSFTNRDGKSLFSFQIPSTHYYDFKKQNEAHTDKPKNKKR